MTPTSSAVRFEHGAFRWGLKLVASSTDAFGFTALYGLRLVGHAALVVSRQSSATT